MTKSPLMPIRFAILHKRSLYAVFALLWLTGTLWLVFHYFLRAASEFGEIANPIEIWWLRLHGLMVFAALVALGSVLPGHARRAWQLNKNRRTGLAMKTLFLWLAFTGYALYYFASEENEAWLPLLHWGAGLTLPLMLAFHVHRVRARLGHRHSHVSTTAVALHHLSPDKAHRFRVQRQDEGG